MVLLRRSSCCSWQFSCGFDRKLLPTIVKIGLLCHRRQLLGGARFFEFGLTNNNFFCSQTTGTTKVMTVKEYDQSKLKEMLNMVLIGSVIISGIVYKFGSSKPLLLQMVFAPKTFFESPLVQIYLFGKAATGKLKRPFAAANPLTGMTPEEPVATEEIKDDGDKEKKDDKKKSKKGSKKQESAKKEETHLRSQIADVKVSEEDNPAPAGEEDEDDVPDLVPASSQEEDNAASAGEESSEDDIPALVPAGSVEEDKPVSGTSGVTQRKTAKSRRD